MKIATLDLTPELFVEFCKASGDHGGLARKFVVIENPLPEDAEVVALTAEPLAIMGALPLLRLTIQSDSFDDVDEGTTPPQLPLVVYRTIYDNSHDYCKGGCGFDFNEFPDMYHLENECGGPECTCYEVIGGHQMGCYFYGNGKRAS